jgi:protein O-mannosyl-transferase
MDDLVQQCFKTSIFSGLVLLLLAWLYWPGIAGPFLLDDFQNIVAVYLEELNWDGLVYMLSHNNSGMFGRSVSMLSFVASGLVDGMQPWWFKFHNLLLHMLNGLLLQQLTLRVLGQLRPDLTERRLQLVAGATALLWLVHPLLVSTVLYAVQRMTQLATLFTLLALLCYWEIRIGHSKPTLRPTLIAWLLFPLSLLLAILSKENGALIPVYLLAFEVTLFRGQWKNLLRNQQVFLLLFIALPLLVGGLYVGTHFDKIANYSVRSFTLAERLLTQLHVLPFYVRWILLPRVRDMSLYHDDFPLTHNFDLITALLLAALLAVFVAIWLLRQRLPVVAFGLAWFLASHLLESTFLPLELVFEHRNYLASFGLLLPLCYALGTALPARTGIAVILCVGLIFALETRSRALEWSSEDVLYRFAMADHPQSSRARTSYANYLFIHDRAEEGVAELVESQRLDPQDVGPVLHLLVARCIQGIDSPELLQQAASSISRYALTVYAYNSLENLLRLVREGQCTVVNVESIRQLLDSAFAYEPNLATPLFHGYLLRFRGMLALLEGHYAEAVIAFRQGHEVSGAVILLAELTEYQIQLKRLDDAEDTLELIKELNAADWLGRESWQVTKLSQLLESARQAASSAATIPQ